MPSEFRQKRLHAQTSKGSGDDRNPFQRDRDRLLYSSAFQRLAEVTQVVSASNGYVFHNRLTHSLQVAQIGRRLAEKPILRGKEKSAGDYPTLDPDVVEAACLGHDIGHPPFGHVAEKQLNELATKAGLDGFEGNAQSFRILTKLAFHTYDEDGLDLTRATLAGILKYPWLKGENPANTRKWGAYLSDKREFDFARANQTTLLQSPEAQIMDWSDDITYSVHDLEDFYMAGRIPLHLLALEDTTREREYFFEDVFKRHAAAGKNYSASRREELEDRFKTLLFVHFGNTEEYRGTRRHRAGLKNFTGTLIRTFINSVSLAEPGSDKPWKIDTIALDQVMMLKELIWTYIINDPALATEQAGQKHMIKHIFTEYCDAAVSSNYAMFPAYFRERLEKGDELERKRLSVDFIASLTENQVKRLHLRITGMSTEASLNDPVR